MSLPDEMEVAFAGAIWATGRDVPQGILPPRNFNIYRNNVYAGLIKSMEARFPVIRRLVGDDFFAKGARIFVEQAPPRSPILLQYGAEFPAFIATFEPARHLPYLGAVAQLEWQRHLAQHGADAHLLDAAKLRSLDIAEMERLSFDLHPTCHIAASSFPIFSIWHTNTFDTVTQAIPANSPGETVLLVRPHDHVICVPLMNGADIFVAKLQQGVALGHAAAQAYARHPQFDLADTLALLFRASIFSGFHLTPVISGQSPCC